MTVEVRRAEIRTQLGTVEGTLSGTYQLDPLTLIDDHTQSSDPMNEAEATSP